MPHVYVLSAREVLCESSEIRLPPRELSRPVCSDILQELRVGRNLSGRCRGVIVQSMRHMQGGPGHGGEMRAVL